MQIHVFMIYIYISPRENFQVFRVTPPLGTLGSRLERGIEPTPVPAIADAVLTRMYPMCSPPCTAARNP